MSDISYTGLRRHTGCQVFITTGKIMKRTKINLVFSLLLFPMIVIGCGGNGNNSNVSAGKSIEDVESEIRNDLDNYITNVDFTLYVKSKNGNSFLHSTGNSSESVSYQSASTSKLVTSAVILSLVNDGVLSLEDSPQDYISSWPITGNLSAIKLKHLLSFTSGLSNAPACINFSVADFESCIDNIINVNADSTTPGDVFYYSPSHLQVAGLMAIKASGNTDWSSVFVQFQSETGLFLDSNYDLPSANNPRLAGGMHWTANDYLFFLDALYNKQILTDMLISQLSSDQISTASIGNSPALIALGEDWHYGYGVWVECKENPYNCTQVKKISSPGAYGAYPFIDFENGYYGILARQGELGTFQEGIKLFESVSQKLKNWALME